MGGGICDGLSDPTGACELGLEMGSILCGGLPSCGVFPSKGGTTRFSIEFKRNIQGGVGSSPSPLVGLLRIPLPFLIASASFLICCSEGGSFFVGGSGTVSLFDGGCS